MIEPTDSLEVPSPAPPGPGRSIAVASVLIMVGSLLSRLLGMVREQLAAGRFGAGDPIAAFTIADNVNALLFDLLASGMLEAALIPVLSGLVAHDLAGRRDLRRVSGALVTVGGVVTGVVAVIGIACAPSVVRLMTALGGGDRGAETTDLTVSLVRWSLPAVPLLAVGVVLMALLYALVRPTAPALAPAIRNGTIVVTVLLLSASAGVRSMAWGTVLGGVLVVVVLLVALWRAGSLPIPNLDLGQPAVREVFRLYLPIFLGLLVSTAAVILDRNLAWGAEQDALGAMRYATTLVQLLLGLVAAAISLATLPHLSRQSADGDMVAFRATLVRTLGLVAVLMIPAVLGLAAIARPTVTLLFEHGATGSASAALIATALLGYLPGHLLAAWDQVLIFSFYAQRNTRTPVVVGVAATAVYALLALLLVDRMGMLGLVIANSAQFAFHTAVMLWLSRETIGRAGFQRLGRTVERAFIAGGVAALAAWVLSGLVRDIAPGGGLAVEVAAVVIPALVAAGIYLGLARMLRMPELDDLQALFAGIGARVRPRS